MEISLKKKKGKKNVQTSVPLILLRHRLLCLALIHEANSFPSSQVNFLTSNYSAYAITNGSITLKTSALLEQFFPKVQLVNFEEKCQARGKLSRK